MTTLPHENSYYIIARDEYGAMTVFTLALQDVTSVENVFKITVAEWTQGIHPEYS